MTVNTQVKGNLAKLLATENLTVEHRKVSTASFDVNNRVLILPIWKDVSGTVYDLLVGHEVGHALYTPNIDVDAPKSFLNVLEDARIERMMKQTYPGLKKSFFEGYRELWHRDFFGIEEEDVNDLSFIDRINLYFKGSTDIDFTVEEWVYVHRASQTKSFQDVVDLANDLYEYAKGKEDQKEELNIPPTESNFDGSADTDKQEEIQPEHDSEDSTDTKQEEFEIEHGSGGGKSDPADLNTPSYEKDGGEVNETECKTDEALQQAIETLVDDNAKDWLYLDLPEIDIDKVIIDNATIQEDLLYHFEGMAFHDESDQTYNLGNLYHSYDRYESYKKDAQRSVNYLVKQFEMKKSAGEYKRAASSKTGVIDTNSLFKYKLTEDIFKRVTCVPEGKNHGLVMFLDWSGSMQHTLIDTLKQTYNLVWFCRKAGIPFRVYGFQTCHRNRDIHPAVNPKKNILTLCEDFTLLEFFSSKQNKQSLDKSMRLIYTQVYAMCYGSIRYMQKYTLGGTPLAEAVMCTPYIVSRLKRQENVTKVNVIALTDGEANPLVYTRERDMDRYPNWDSDIWINHMSYGHAGRTKFMIRDPKSGYTREISPSPYETTKEIVSFYREITDYNWVGIRICSSSELKRVGRSLNYEQYEKIAQDWRKNKFASVKNILGFSQSFYMPDNNIGGSTSDLEIKQKGEVATKAELTRSFKKHMGSKMTNKTILNAFIEQIA